MATQEQLGDTRLNSDLWLDLAAMNITPPGAPLGFTDKLARDNGWSHQQAEVVMEEYRRFLFLAATGSRPVSPPQAVDRAWHLHLTYSRHYWKVLCGSILGRPFHHEPSLGGEDEDERHRSQYLRTLDRYRAAFGSPPPKIWPDPRQIAEQRSSGPALLGVSGAAAASLLLAACTALTGDSGTSSAAWIILVAAVIFVLTAIVAIAHSSRVKKSKDNGGCGGGGYTGGDGGDSSDGGSSCGGCGGD